MKKILIIEDSSSHRHQERVNKTIGELVANEQAPFIVSYHVVVKPPDGNNRLSMVKHFTMIAYFSHFTENKEPDQPRHFSEEELSKNPTDTNKYNN